MFRVLQTLAIAKRCCRCALDVPLTPPPRPPIHPQRRLSVTLKQAYGADAFSLVPLTFSLPTELPAWRAYLDKAAAEGRDPGPWMLKTAQHLGMGLCLLPGEQAYSKALQPRCGAGRNGASTHSPCCGAAALGA